ncbi:hypothetical protein GCM10023311_16580 [Flaviramulus aquimarinus]|uniref:Secreted protein n=1 Tax=Flaviramulus aquimarinus TaxID=1170456 RepID=A0ABP9F2I2_9FLAO
MIFVIRILLTLKISTLFFGCFKDFVCALIGGIINNATIQKVRMPNAFFENFMCKELINSWYKYKNYFF